MLRSAAAAGDVAGAAAAVGDLGLAVAGGVAMARV